MTTQRIGMGLLLVAVMLLSTVEARNLHNNWPDLKDGRLILWSLWSLAEAFMQSTSPQ